MPAFVDRPDYLTTFLESVFEKLWGTVNNSSSSPATSATTGVTSPVSETATVVNGLRHWSLQEQEERKTIWNTLLELYLMDDIKEPTSARERQKRKREFRQKALTLLHDESVHYDTNQALVLCQLKQFDEGIVYLYEKTGMYTDILRYWMDKGNTDRVIEGVRKYG